MSAGVGSTKHHCCWTKPLHPFPGVRWCQETPFWVGLLGLGSSSTCAGQQQHESCKSITLHIHVVRYTAVHAAAA